MDAPSGSLVAFSTAPGKAALDGPDGGNSHYTAALAQAMAEPGLKIEEVFKKVRVAVREKTKGEQTPWESTSLTGDFYPAGEKPQQAAIGTLQEQAPSPAAKPIIPLFTYEDKTQRLLRTFRGHSEFIKSVAISPDGRTVLSGSWGDSLKLWDIASGRELHSFPAHKETIFSIAISPDGLTALAGCWDKTLKMWDIATGRELRSFTGHSEVVNSVAIFPDGLTALSGSNDNTMKLWDIASGREFRSFTGRADAVWSVAISQDGRAALSGGLRTLELWDVSTGRELRSFSGHSDWVDSVAISPDGRMALSGSYDKTMKLWDIASGREIRTFTGYADWVSSVVFSPDGRYILSGSCAKVKTYKVNNETFYPCIMGSMKLWATSSGRELHEFSGHSEKVNAVAFSPDGRFALSGSDDNTLKLWDVPEWTQPREARR